MSLTIGTIFRSSWGYDQTNITFYEVTKVTPSTVTVRRLKQSREESPRAMCGTTLPLPGSYDSEPMRRAIKSDGAGGYSLKISSYEWARLWNGKPAEFTSYA